jgi:hypothetical protein
MTAGPIYADAEGAIVAWATAHPTLTGAGNPLAAGLHMNEVRSPAEGAIGYLEILDRSADDVADLPRVSAVIASKSRGVAEAAARAYADALQGLVRTRPLVTTSRGEHVAIQAAGDIAGPSYGGDFGGEHAYRVDATFVLQPR